MNCELLCSSKNIMAKTKKSYSSEKYLTKRRETKKLSMRRAQEKLKDNPELLEEARKKDRERKKKQRKRISELNSYDQRNQRKKWREYSKTYCANIKKKRKILEEELDINTPPQSPGLNVAPLPSTSRLESGKTERRKLRKAMKKLEEKNKELLQQVEKYRKRACRSDSSSSVENSFNNCLKNPKVNDYIIVKLSGKKSFHYYIGLVLQHHKKELVVKFLKKSSVKKFVFPEIDDISSIHLKDIVCVLNQPLVNSRQQYEFIIN